MPNVIYWELREGKIKNIKRAACFNGLSFYNSVPSRIVYLIPIDKSLYGLDKEINFYLNFLDNILNTDIYRYKRIKTVNYENHLMFTIKVGDLQRCKVLLYLTAFRYFDEFPEIVKEFFKFKDIEDLDTLFQEFLRIHFNYNKLFIDVKYGDLPGHGLTYHYPYYDGKEFNPLSINEFKQNLNELETNGVAIHFKEHPAQLGDKYKNKQFTYKKFNFTVDKV